MVRARPHRVDDLPGNEHLAATHYDARMSTATASLREPAHAPPPVFRPFGEHLRFWRQHRRLSQLDLAAEADISTRHLSFVETGRSSPSREMVLRLAERLSVPLRERNALLVAAGFAPMYRERSLDDPALAAARRAVDLILKSHEPFPALAVDRHWNLLAGNAMLQPLLAGADPSLLQAPVNVLRLSLHPKGIASQIINLGQWRTHIFERMRQQVQATGDAQLAALLEELRGYPVPPGAEATHLEGELLGVAMPFLFRSAHGDLSFISTTTVFGSPVDVTLQELALETFFPADPFTAQALQEIAARLKA
jgi:transcriptional regulator with XRE-family HTH domain